MLNKNILRFSFLYLIKNKLYKNFFLVILLSFFSVFFEILSLGSVPLLFSSFALKNFDSHIYFIQYFDNFSIFQLVLLVIITFVLKNLYLLFIYFLENKFIEKINFKIKSSLFRKVSQNLNFSLKLFHHSKISSIVIESGQHYANYFSLVINIFREFFVLIFIFIFLIISVPYNTVVVMMVLTLITYFFFKIINVNLKNIGKKIQNFTHDQFKIISDSFHLSDFLKIYNKDFFFDNKFSYITQKKEHLTSRVNFIGKIPKIILEISGILILLSTILLLQKSLNTIDEVIVVLSIIGVSVIRMIPLFNSLTTSLILAKRVEVPCNQCIKILKIRHITKKNVRKELNLLDLKKNFVFEIKNLKFSYNKINIFKNLNFKITKNKIVGVTGESGAGKTTFLKILLGLYNPTGGSIKLNNKNIFNNIQNWQALLGYVSQSTVLINDQIRRNIAFGCGEDEIDDEKVYRVLKQVDLLKIVNKRKLKIYSNLNPKINNLSGGQLQRIAIARALYFNPKILIMDEPTNALDVNHEMKIFKMLKKIKNIRIKIIVTHSPNLLKYCDEVIKIKNENL